MRLSDILANGSGNDLKKSWDETEAAGEMGALPPGDYVSHIVGGELETSRTNQTPGYKLTFKVVEGDFTGRLFWQDCWLTPAALPQTKRDLAKIGVTSLEQLETPLPRFIRCKCRLAVRRDDDGNERNRLKSFEVIGIDTPEQDAFAPADSESSESTPVAATVRTEPESGTEMEPTPPTEGGERVPF